MKKITLLCLMPIILAGCGKNDQPATGSGAYKKWSYLVPVQAPAVAMSEFATLEKFETTTEPSSIPSLMAAKKYDVVVAPTNVGANAIKNAHAEYKLLATITFGNFYIASTGHDDDGIMDVYDYIVNFQPAGIPNKVFSYVYNGGFQNVAHTVASNLAAQTCLETGKNQADNNADVDYVLISEPSLTIGLGNNENAEIYEDLQSKYYLKSGGSIITQASVFVKSSLYSDDVKKEFLPLLKSSIEGYISNPTTLKESMNKVENAKAIFGVTPDVAFESTKNGNRMGLGIKESSTILEDTNKFLQVLGAPQFANEDIA